MMRIGQGFDVHALVEGRPLIIGGVVGTAKAVGSLIVVLLFIKEFI